MRCADQSFHPGPRWFLCAAALSILLAGPARAQSGVPGAPRFPIERYRLDNGLEVILHEDHTVALAHVSVWYHVGSGDGVAGKSGLAHFCEHMMFEGSKHVKPGEHFQVLGVAGNPDANATTSADRTNYFETVPAHQLETALWLESDRMGFLFGALDQGRFDNQRDVVRNERRQRYENAAFGAEFLAIGEALYPEGHPYRHLTIGLHQDLERASLDDAREWFLRWYGPGNATLLIAGDIDRAATRALVSKWFGKLPGRPRPAHHAPAVATVKLPVQRQVDDPFTKIRRIRYVWPAPKAYSDEAIALDVLGSILGRTPTGRLYRSLVIHEGLAQGVAAGLSGRGFSSEFHVSIDLRPGADAIAARAVLDAEIERLSSEPVTARELRQAVAGIEVSFATAFETLADRGEAMQEYNHYLGNPDSFGWELGKIRGVTPAGLRALAARILGAARAEIITVPADTGRP